MAQEQEPEVLLAQRLAANERTVRTKAFKKLRRYVRSRSQIPGGGFTEDELLKIWKGLFYCLWMQDKAVLQEELSEQISGLLLSFQNTDTQLLYVETFLKTVKREWNGIDRLRLDKFYQLVRFVFRQVFETLKRNEWEESLNGRVLQLISAQLLDGSAPAGLLLHILDLYLSELSRAGAQQLTADQNLSFIEPFCQTAAKTKDRVVLQAICTSLFGLIVEQAPFAVVDLLKELKAQVEGEESDSGQASEGEEPDATEGEGSSSKVKLLNGKKTSGLSTSEEEGFSDGDVLDLDEDLDLPGEEDIGPVLQFDYGAVAEKLFQLASRTQTPSHNRAKLYKLVKTFRDLSEGVFPQDEGPEDVSTDEDDEEFSRKKKRKKRKQRPEDQEDAHTPPKRQKGEAAEEQSKKKKKKNKRKKKDTPPQKEESVVDTPLQEAAITVDTPPQKEESVVDTPLQEAAITVDMPLLKEESVVDTPLQEAAITVDTPPQKEESVVDTPLQEAAITVDTPPQKEESDVLQATPSTEEEPVVMETDPDITQPLSQPEAEPNEASESSQSDVVGVPAEEQPAAEGKRKKRSRKQETQSLETGCDVTEKEEEEEQTSTPADAKKKRRKKKMSVKDADAPEGPDAHTPDGPDTHTPDPVIQQTASPPEEEEEEEVLLEKPKGRKKKKKAVTPTEDGADAHTPDEADTHTPDEADTHTPDEESAPTPLEKKKKKKKAVITTEEADTHTPDGADTHTPVEALTDDDGADKKKKKKKKKLLTEEEDEGVTLKTCAKEKTVGRQKKKQLKTAGSEFISFQSSSPPKPLFCKKKGVQVPQSKAKKVTFGLKNNKTAEASL
ncbi:ribosomal RNA processing protein 1 homolog B-like isoform X3 [Clupea harengus]|uniref:Ribosomal RNA processing protein 1 homolog B-like isoform X3 n=1 Tax=Clupea harengus TaxID=7950 RepID=A0A6P8G9V8_CLUHA|nr:ribosomal RNA processing protein 1 homolog B-like isoform X3 [Clupea harengus]